MDKVICFDFDGVILESVSVKKKAIFDLFEDATKEDRERVLKLHYQTPGIERRERINMLLTQGLGRKATPEEVNRLLDRFAQLVWDGLMNCPEVLGVRKFLENISFKMPCYVVSAAPQDEVRAVAQARDFYSYFVDILGTPPSKTERIKEIIRRENTLAQYVLFIGDKISDYQAAQATGCKFLARHPQENRNDFPDGTVVIENFQSGVMKDSEFFANARAGRLY